MSRTDQPDTTGKLAKLPIDVLLNVSDNCDVADILSLSLTCKQLRTATEERQVWVTQFKRCCVAFRQAPFHSRTKELLAHSTAQLKSWTIQQAHTDALWLQNEDTDDNLELQEVHLNHPEGVQYQGIFLLPGGEHLVLLTEDNAAILKKIERGDDIGDSGWGLVDVAVCLPPNPDAEFIEEVFTDTICEYPLIVYHHPEIASVTIFRLDYDSQTIPVQKNIQINHGGALPGGYRMGYFGIRGDAILWLYADYEGGPRQHLLVAKLDDPDGAATRLYLNLDWNAWVHGCGCFEVLTANAFIRYGPGMIYLHHVPRPSPETQSRGRSGESPTPTVVWSYRVDSGGCGYGGIYYSRTDSVLPNFSLRGDRSSHIIEFTMDSTERPFVLNHFVTPTNGDPKNGIGVREVDCRRVISFGVDAAGRFLLNTTFLDRPDQHGHFRTVLRQYGLVDADEDSIEAIRYDEVTGRILLLFGEFPCEYARKLFLADLPWPRHGNSHDLQQGLQNPEKQRATLLEDP